MLVSKRKYNAILCRNIELEKELELNTQELLKSKAQIVYLKKEYKLVEEIYRDIKSELNQTISMSNTLEELKSQKEVIELDIIYGNIELNLLKEKVNLVSLELKSKSKELVGKFDFEISNLKNDIQDLQSKKEYLALNIESENLKFVSIKQNVLSIEKRLEDLCIENTSKLESCSILNLEIAEQTQKQIDIRKSVEYLSEQHANLLKKIENANQEIIIISENKYLNASILERELLQNLEEKIYHSSVEIKHLSLKLEDLEKELCSKEIETEEFEQLKRSVVLLREEKDLQEVAFYKNIFPFNTTEKFKEKMNKNIKKQKELIRDKKVVDSKVDWSVNGSIREGRKMTDLNIKLMIRSYNTECDNAISNLKYSTLDSAVNRINKSCIAIDKLNEKNGLSISKSYHNLKLEELRLVFELKLFEKNEREKLRVFREEERERKKIEQETKDKLNELSLHEKQIKLEITYVNKELEKFNGENIMLLNRIKKLEDSLLLISKKRTEINRRQAISKSGYVYIISNIGTMGENIYKIGMTRRLEPTDRIKELSGAAVPFEFDIHAMILTDDAPLLENHLHSVFHSSRVNLINNRKEFFAITLDEIKKEVFSVVGKDVVFEDVSYASQYFETLSMKKKNSREINVLDVLLKM